MPSTDHTYESHAVSVALFDVELLIVKLRVSVWSQPAALVLKLV